MRISDWSSDVCSSDLDGVRHLSRARGGSLAGEAAAEIIDGNGNPGLRSRASSKRAAVVPDSGQRRHRRHRADDSTHAALMRPGAQPTSRSTTILPKRSEEHTSELQSLMRISYAVFCLKKKTKNNNKLVQAV